MVNKIRKRMIDFEKESVTNEYSKSRRKGHTKAD